MDTRLFLDTLEGPIDHLRVRIKDPSYTDRDGLLHYDEALDGWENIIWFRFEGCDHIETCCPYCLRYWNDDYNIIFVRRNGTQIALQVILDAPESQPPEGETE